MDAGAGALKYDVQAKIEYVDPKQLRPAANNPRVLTRKQQRRIAKSIATFGFVTPMLVDGQGTIIAGHTRFAAAIDLKLKRVPIIRIEHLNADEITALRIADNKLTETGQWNYKALAEQFKELVDLKLDFDPAVTGFDPAEIDQLLDSLVNGCAADATDDFVTPKGPAVTRLGDLWTLDHHRVLCGSSVDRMSFNALMVAQRATMMFTDPPYNVPISGNVGGKGAIQHDEFKQASGEMTFEAFIRFLTDVLRYCVAVSQDGSLHYICMDWRHLRELLAAGHAVYADLMNICIWAKDNGGMGSLYRSAHELILVFKNGTGRHQNNVQLGKFGRNRTNVWSYPGMNSFSRKTDEGNLLELHPTVKPVALVKDAILDASKRHDIILDPFLGSGTTLIAAQRTGRRCYGIELDPLYVDTIIRRWQAFTGDAARHEASGRTFTDIEQDQSHGQG